MKIGRSSLLLILLNLFLIILTRTVEDITPPPISTNTAKMSKKSNFSFWISFLQSFLLIIFSEIGDNTFVLCLIFSREIPKFTIFFISILSLFTMNLISIGIGYSLLFFIYDKIVDWFAIVILVVYGIWLLDESTRMEIDYEIKKEDEINQDEVKASQVKKIDSGLVKYYFYSKSNMITHKSSSCLIIPDYIPPYDKKIKVDEENNFIKINQKEIPKSIKNIEEESENRMNLFCSFFSSIFIGECGDRSQICTIVISSIFDPIGVIAGTCLAYLVGVSLSIFLGRFITSKVSEKLISIICGLLLLIYSVEIYLIKL